MGFAGFSCCAFAFSPALLPGAAAQVTARPLTAALLCPRCRTAVLGSPFGGCHLCHVGAHKMPWCACKDCRHMTHVCPTRLSCTSMCASIPLGAPIPVAQWLAAFGVGLGMMEVAWEQPHSSAPCTRWQQPSSTASDHAVRRLHMAPAAPWASKPSWLLPSPSLSASAQRWRKRS